MTLEQMPATVQDIERRWRPLTPQENINAEAFLEDAWWLLTDRRPSLVADMEAEKVSTGNVVRLLAHIVRRILINPEGLLEEYIDDYRKRRDNLVSTGRLYVTDDELAELIPGGRVKSSSRKLRAYGEC